MSPDDPIVRQLEAALEAEDYERSTPPRIDPGLVGLLLARGADPDRRGPGGTTPLDLARRKKDARVIQMLVQRSTP